MKLYIYFSLITQALSSIIFTISSTPFQYQCVNNVLSIFGTNMFIKGNVNGVQFALPMEEIGLPIINMDWFVNGVPTPVNIIGSFNVNNIQTSQNRWSFQLQDDQPNIGAGTIQLGPCIQNTIYSITADFTSDSFISGVGVPELNIPPASGIPLIINNLAPENIYTPGQTTPATTTPTPSTTTPTPSTTTPATTTKPTTIPCTCAIPTTTKTTTKTTTPTTKTTTKTTTPTTKTTTKTTTKSLRRN